jgi:uncharacterized protein (TIGR03437 family)
VRTTFIGIAISFSVWALGAQAQTPTFTAASVLNAASRVAGPIAPGMVVAITGSNLGDPSFPGNCMNGTPVPNTCTAVRVLVNGVAVPKLFDSGSEVTFQAPFNLSGTTATVQVTSSLSGSTVSSAIVTVPVAAVNPGIYTAGGTGTGTAYYFDGTGLIPQYSQPVLPGDTVVLFATGFGVTNPVVATGVLGPSSPGAMSAAAVTMTINNKSVPVTYAGLEPGNQSGAVVGYDEVVFTVPAGLAQGSYPVMVTAGSTASMPVNLLVAASPVTITSISPATVGLSANLQTVTFTGTGFETGLTLKVLAPPPATQPTTISGSNITFISPTQFSAMVTVNTAGLWDALVTNPDGSESSAFSFPASGSVSGNGPTITKIVTTSSGVGEISQNSWIEVHGTNLANTTTTWSNANFANGLPTSVGNVSATVDGLPAAIYYVSSTQVNILTPLDSAAGTVEVQLSTPNGTTPMTPVLEVPIEPALLVVDVAGHVAAEHVPSYALLGPPSLNAPGYSFTPAAPGETVTVYCVGFGQTNPAYSGQLANLGPFPINLPSLPTVTVGNLPANVSFAGLVGAGLYQINLTIPASAPAGDLPIVAMYGGMSTQTTALITVQ